MSKQRPTFSEMMARFGFDPRKEHPEIAPPPQPTYLGRGEWGPPGVKAELDDDRGYGSEEDEFFADLLDAEPPVAPPERPWYDRDG